MIFSKFSLGDDTEERISNLMFVAMQNGISILQVNVSNEEYKKIKKTYKRTPLYIQTGFGIIQIKKNLPITFNGGSKKK